MSLVLGGLLLLSAGLACSRPPVAARAPAAKSSADWPGFRGPNRDDLSQDKGLLTRWPKEGPKLVWKCEGIGAGYSSVSMMGNKVFTMGDKKDSSYVFGIDRENGKILWEARVGKPGGNYSGTRSTPTVDGDRVYVLGQFGDFVCLDTGTGQEKWRKNFPSEFGGRHGFWQYAESPLIDGDRLICTPGGAKAGIVALNKLTGEVIWKSEVGDWAAYSSIVISLAAGVKQYVQLTADGVVGVAAKDGKLLWRYKKLANNTANIPTCIVLGEQIFCVAGYGKGAALLTLRSDGAGGVKMTEEYYQNEMHNKHGGVVIVGDLAFGDTDDQGKLYCADWKTGKVRWQGQSKSGRGSISLTCANGHLYLRYSNGFVALIEASPKGYEEKGLFKIPNGRSNTWAHPVVCGGRLYIREQDILWVYDVKAGPVGG
jgi:outer membrane protein assembly factor BamB